jgi:PAS domain S-box-containing protein
MDVEQSRRISEVAQLCARAEEPDAFLAAVLPYLTEFAVAAAAVVVRVVAGGELTVVARRGRDVDVAALAGGTGPDREGDPLQMVEAPGAWVEAGLRSAAVRRIGPQRERFLVLAWEGDPLVGTGPWHETVATLTDTTMARLTAEGALDDLQQRVDSAQQLADMGDYDWHIATDSNRWSDQLYRIYGHEPQSFNASYERFLSLIHPDDRERITRIHQHAYATGEPYQMIERIVRPDGSVRYLSSNGQVLMGEDGTPERMRGTCIDVTDQVLAERLVEESAARFRDLVEASPDAILVLDAGGRVLEANHHATALLGGDPMGRDIVEVVEPPLATKEDVPATAYDGRALRLDITTVDLRAGEDDGPVAAFLRDARVRLDAEAAAADLAEAQVRRRQALEINDNVVQGLTAAVHALEVGRVEAALSYVDGTLGAARRMMTDLLAPLDGSELRAGDLVRATPARIVGGPLPEPSEAPAPAEPQRPRVLVVDDAEDIRMLLKIRLSSHGAYEVVGEAADGVAAVAEAARLQPDLVLLDLAMPRMDGLEALPQIRAAVPGVRVIVLSGFDAGPMAATALEAGARRYLEKGRAISTLGDVIAEVLDEP